MYANCLYEPRVYYNGCVLGSRRRSTCVYCSRRASEQVIWIETTVARVTSTVSHWPTERRVIRVSSGNIGELLKKETKHWYWLNANRHFATRLHIGWRIIWKFADQFWSCTTRTGVYYKYVMRYQKGIVFPLVTLWFSFRIFLKEMALGGTNTNDVLIHSMCSS